MYICTCCACDSGVTAGAIGSFIGTPAEISLIRMTSDGRSVYVCECTHMYIPVHVHVYLYNVHVH